MKSYRRYRVTRTAIRQMKNLGVDGDPSDFLVRIARLSAPCTHPRGNRRYEKWVMRIRDNTIIGVAHVSDKGPSNEKTYPSAINCTLCEGTMAVWVEDECEHCLGAGCRSCDKAGMIRRRRPCPKKQDNMLDICEEKPRTTDKGSEGDTNGNEVE